MASIILDNIANATSSSPDPLALSTENRSRIITTPSRSRSVSPRKRTTPVRSMSPQKSVIIDPMPDSATSPWRIRVTVQAEPRDDQYSPSKITRTITVPLKDSDDGPKSPKKGRGRTPRAQTPRKRPPTPAKTELSQANQSKRRKLSKDERPVLQPTRLLSDLSVPDIDSDEDTTEINLDDAIEDDTMMKSAMDMTIVSPTSLYSHIDSSRLTNKAEEASKTETPSSPHVTFSSPLVAPTKRPRSPSASREIRPPSRSSLKLGSRPPSISPPQPSRKLNPLPTPDSDVEMSDDEPTRPQTQHEKELEQRWAEQRQHVIKQAQNAPPEAIIDITSDEESETNEVDDDIWQEAANEAGSAENSYISTRPSIATYKQAQRFTSHEVKPVTEPVDVTPAPSKQKPTSDMSILFNRFAGRQGIDDSIVDSPDESKEDLSAFLRRKVAKVMDAVDFSLITPAKKLVVPTIETSTKVTSVPVKFNDSTSELLSPRHRQQYSPKRSSPLRNPVTFDDEEEESDSDMEDMAESPKERQSPSPRSSSPRTSPPRSSPPRSSPPRSPSPPKRRKSLLKVTQERKARMSFLKSPPPPAVRHSEADSMTSTEPDITAAPEQAHATGKLYNYFFHQPSTQAPMSSAFPPPRPSHPLLKHMRLLPRIHPWSNNHFQALLSLYKHWQTHTEMYNPAFPENAALLTPAWLRFIDVEFSNWGFDLLLTPSLIVLAALFSKLLVLADATEYRALYGEDLEMGYLATKTLTDGAITEWHIALRLFTVAVGDVVRAEEEAGRTVDRTPALKWRFKGQWLWKRGWYWGLL